MHHSHPAALLIRSASKAAAPVDPERPKRANSAYFRFAAAHREKHSETKQTAKQIAQAWSQLDAAEKQPFILLSTTEREAYRKKFEEYKASGKLDAWRRDPALPKRPVTPFFVWAGTERNAPHLQKLKVAEQAKLLGASWAALAEEKKAPLLAKYKADAEVYVSKMKAYKDSGAHQEWLKRTGRLEGIEKNVAKKQAEKDKVLEAKAKEKAKKEATKEKEKAKALATAAKVKDGLRKEKLKATAAKAAEKVKNEKAISITKAIKAKEAAKASQANKKAKDTELKAKEKEKAAAAKAKEAAAKKKAGDKEKAAKAAAKAKEKLAAAKAKENVVVAKATKGGSASANARA